MTTTNTENLVLNNDDYKNNNKGSIIDSEGVDVVGVDDDHQEFMSDHQLNGLLVTYKDDQLETNIKSQLRGKLRVRYKCLDTYGNFLAFGTTGGAIYLYKLKSITHSSCELTPIIPCDQGSIEVIRFLPNPQTDDLSIAIGTTRGSLVIFKLISQQLNATLSSTNNLNLSSGVLSQHQSRNQLHQQQHLYNSADNNGDLFYNEIYRAESFTSNGSGIKLLEYDQDLLDPSYPFNKLYICDMANRLYVLDNSTINSSKKKFKFYSTNLNSHLPSLILSVSNDSKINQIHVQRSQLLISTDETTRLFNEQTNQLIMIGSKKRHQEGFYGACFFNQNYKPIRILQMSSSGSRQFSTNSLAYSSTNSICDLGNLLIFVARQDFRLWQVGVDHNLKFNVNLTHQFKPMLEKSLRRGRSNSLIELDNEPIEEEKNSYDNPEDVMEKFNLTEGEMDNGGAKLRSRHFQKLQPIYSSTLGNLLLSYTKHELFVLDPMEAKLIVWHSQREQIIQVCSNENELFIWSFASDNSNDTREFKFKRIVLLAATQFVLELHRLHRYWTMISFVDRFYKLFRHKMALPIDGSSVITTEGGLLRNVLLNAWDIYESKVSNSNDDPNQSDAFEYNYDEFKKMVDEIVEESQQLRQSLDNLTDSRFFLSMTNENIDRLCSEPYASLVSLEVSIADLHTSQVIHFTKDALNRHKSVANLSKNLQNVNRFNKQVTKSNFDLSSGAGDIVSSNLRPIDNNNSSSSALNSKQVLVERLRPKRRPEVSENSNVFSASNGNGEIKQSKNFNQYRPFFSNKELIIKERFNEDDDDGEEGDASASANDRESSDAERDKMKQLEEKLELKRESRRCKNCRWPLAKAHLKVLDSIQQIQLNWIEENLSSNFLENIEQIEKIAFNNGLWRLYIKCLATKDKNLDEYLLCCLALDDIRLLDVERMVNQIFFYEEEFFDKVLQKLDYSLKCKSNLKPGQGICLKCKQVFELPKNDGQESEDELNEIDRLTHKNSYEEDEFKLENLFDKFTIKRHLDVKKTISHLKNYPELLNNSNLKSSFYLKVISRYIANQTAAVKTSKKTTYHIRA